MITYNGPKIISHNQFSSNSSSPVPSSRPNPNFQQEFDASSAKLSVRSNSSLSRHFDSTPKKQESKSNTMNEKKNEEPRIDVDLYKKKIMTLERELTAEKESRIHVQHELESLKKLIESHLGKKK